MTEANNKMKKCSKCKSEKDRSSFGKRSNVSDGLRSECNECRKKYIILNKKKIAKYKKQYYDENQDKIRKYFKQYCARNQRKRSAQHTKWHREKYRTNINYKLACNLRSRQNAALKNNQKTGSAICDLGCSIEEFKRHLEKLFYSHPKTGELMTWDNYGLFGWHIDHIKPLSGFDLTARNQFLVACHYTNLQPLWAEENLKKGTN